MECGDVLELGLTAEGGRAADRASEPAIGVHSDVLETHDLDATQGSCQLPESRLPQADSA